MYLDCKSFIVYSTPYTAATPPTNLWAVPERPTGIHVFWTPPTPLGYTTGYRIYYRGGSNGSVDVSGGSTDYHTLTGLQNGANYIISIVGTSEHFFSAEVEVTVSLGEKDSPLSLQSSFLYMCVYHCSSWAAKCHCELNNSHHHLPLLECSRWLSGGQL